MYLFVRFVLLTDVGVELSIDHLLGSSQYSVRPPGGTAHPTHLSGD